MPIYEALVREEIEATIDRAGFESLNLEALRVEVTDSFRRKLGECRPISPSDSDSTVEYEIRIAYRLFENEYENQWYNTVRHEVAHAYVFETAGREVQSRHRPRLQHHHRHRHHGRSVPRRAHR